jgi:hypothetical protein
MLRLTVIVLLLANAGYYAWSQGHLAEWGLAPAPQGEPQRLQQQIRPEAVRLAGEPVRPPARPASVAATVPEPSAAQASAEAPPASVPATEPARPAGECLQAGVFDEEQANALRRAAAALPQGSWSLQRTAIPGRWMVYMGKFADADALAKKRAELRELGISYDRPSNASLEPGLSLGRFSTEEAAQRGLGNLAAKGVRSAKVVQERPDTPGYQLRLPSVDDALRSQLEVLRPAMAGKTLKPCS